MKKYILLESRDEAFPECLQPASFPAKHQGVIELIIFLEGKAKFSLKSAK